MFVFADADSALTESDWCFYVIVNSFSVEFALANLAYSACAVVGLSRALLKRIRCWIKPRNLAKSCHVDVMFNVA